MKILIICNCTTGLERFRGMLIEKLLNKKRVSVIVPVSDEEKELEAEKELKKCHAN